MRFSVFRPTCKQPQIVIYLLFVVVIFLALHSKQECKPTAVQTDRNDLHSIRQERKLELERLLDTWCDPRNISLQHECLQHLDNKLDHNYFPPTRLVLFHSFWHIQPDSDDHEFYFRVFQLSLMSFLATQAPAHSRLVIWTLASFPDSITERIQTRFDRYFRRERVEFRRFDLDEMCAEAARKKTRFAKCPACRRSNRAGRFEPSTQFEYVGFSDLVRFFVLDIFGGNHYLTVFFFFLVTFFRFFKNSRS